MNITLSIKDALFIQECQILWYRMAIGRQGIKAIRKRTNIPANLDINKQRNVIEINKYIPRGGTFEGYIKKPGKCDCLNINWYNAKREGKLYH